MTNETTKLNYPLIVVMTTPSSGYAWIAWDEADLLNAYYHEDSTDWLYEEYDDLAEWVSMWGDDEEDWPDGTGWVSSAAWPCVAITKNGVMEVIPKSEAESFLDFVLDYFWHECDTCDLCETKAEAETLLTYDQRNLPREQIRERVNDLLDAEYAFDWK